MVKLDWDNKYDKNGNKSAPLQIALPFQTIETLNESTQQRQKTIETFLTGRGQIEWRNRLIWGDKKYVLPSLLPEFASSVDLIYIDPPYDTGLDFSYIAKIPELDASEKKVNSTFTKLPSIIEQKAYRDTWGEKETHLDSWINWFYETLVFLSRLLKPTGSIYIHLDWRVVHYAKIVGDEIFGRENFRNELIWHYKGREKVNPLRFASKHDTILVYAKSEQMRFNELRIEWNREERIKMLRRKIHTDPKTGKQWFWETRGQSYGIEPYKRDLDEYLNKGQAYTDTWTDIPKLRGNHPERTPYPTQKPKDLLKRIIDASSKPGDLVLDCFCGSGTTAVTAEENKRRWITCDLSRFSIHTTRKRLLNTPQITPFIIQNLGKYERQAWQISEFGNDINLKVRLYINFILSLYCAQPLEGHLWLHGVKGKRLVHVGSVDSPISPLDVGQIVAEYKRTIGTGKDAPKTNGIDILGWDFAFEINEKAKQQSTQANVDIRFLRIPREVLDKKAIEQGDITFFELAALDVNIHTSGKKLSIKINDFVIPADDVPAEIQKEIKHWSQWIDYWAIDWDNKNDTFHNEWQEYRTIEKPMLTTEASKIYTEIGEYRVVVKVIDILGNDTTKMLKVTIR